MSKLYIAHIQLHGLIKQVPELGFDADTGGQILYVLDLAAEHAKSEKVERVEIITRMIVDDAVSEEYAVERENVAEGYDIVRISTSPTEQYVHKEHLWGLIPLFTDRLIEYFRSTRFPDVIHAHYADAGMVAALLTGIHNHVTIFTGHSLGISKKKYLLKLGETEEDIESAYNISKRIFAEELALQNADIITSSSYHEKNKQYDPYNSADPSRTRILSPGVDLQKFGLDIPLREEMKEEIEKFFTDKDKPIILAITRPVKKKNIHSMIKAYGQSPELQEKANLCLILGTRDDIDEMDDDTKEIMIEVLVTIDQYDLYGKVAYPKTHVRTDIPAIYNYAYTKRGIFTNVAYTEPFGLTALEASASGLPCVVTKRGGISEIISMVANGLIVDPNDLGLIARCSLELITNEPLWEVYSANGLRVDEIFSWESHVNYYLKLVYEELEKKERLEIEAPEELIQKTTSKQFIFVELDDLLQGDSHSLESFSNVLNGREDIFLGYATGRNSQDARAVIRKHSLPEPQAIICNAGSEISFTEDEYVSEYKKIISYKWDRELLKESLEDMTFLVPQDQQNQSELKLSYTLDYDILNETYEIQKEHGATDVPENNFDSIVSQIHNRLQKTGIPCSAICSHDQYIDILPGVANKGNALRFISVYLNIPLNQFHTFSSKNNDKSILNGWINGTITNTEPNESFNDYKLSALSCVESIISFLE